MAFRPDQPPVPPGGSSSPDAGDQPQTDQPQPAPPEPPVTIDFDRMVEDIHGEVKKQSWRSLAAREAEARARSLGREADQRSATPSPLRAPLRGVVKSVTRAAEFFNLDLKEFPSFGLMRRAFSAVDTHTFAHGRERGTRGAREFFDLCARYETFKLMKQLRREQGRAPTKAELDQIKQNIINEQPHAAVEYTREPFDIEEVTRQERVMERFGDALHKGNYAAATRIYRDVLKQVSSGGMVIDARRRWQLEDALARNRKLPKGFREKPEAIEQRIIPGGMTEDRLRNERLQKYLRILASQHIIDMMDGRIPAQLPNGTEHRFVAMVRDLSAMTEMTRDDIPTDDTKIQRFFDQIKEGVSNDIAAAAQQRASGEATPITNRVYTALRLGILTPDELNAIDPQIGHYIMEEGASHEPTLRDRVLGLLHGIREQGQQVRTDIAQEQEDDEERQPTRGERVRMALGDIAGRARELVQETPEQRQLNQERETREYLTRIGARERTFSEKAGVGLVQSPENVERTRQYLRDAWRRDIANDNDEYSNFDGARTRVIQRYDVLPRTTYTYKYPGTNQQGKEVWFTGTVEGTTLDARIAQRRTEKDAAIERLKKNIATLQKERPDKYQDHVREAQERIAFLEEDYRLWEQRAKEEDLRAHALMQPEAIEQEIMTDEFRTAVKDRLIAAFRSDLSKYDRQLDAVTRIREETYAPYRICDDGDIRDVVGALRDTHGPERLLQAARRGEPMLLQEEDALIRRHLFTRAELDGMHADLMQRAGR